jgi:hypothetical protein
MPDDPKDPAKKLIIDEDWKSQVEAEKEAEKAAAQPPPEAQEPAEARPSSARGSLPPADLTFLVSSLYLQGIIALGLMVSPVTKKANVQLDQAKHVIDMLTMLQQKTEGNRTPEESADLEGALHELRLTYVTISEGPEPKK